MIHPTAIIDPKAEVADSVEIGPYSVIDGGVTIGPHCHIGPHVYVTGQTTLGSNNRVHAGCVIGDAPQDLKYDGGPTRLTIGDHNTFREGVTIHRSNHADESTLLGSHNYFMANSHVGHNARLGDRIILANGALLGGHVVVDDQVFISANAGIHQFVRIGRLALLQGGGRYSKDVPPFTIATGLNCLCGLNQLGLRRAEYPPEQRTALKQAYKSLFLESQPITQAAKQARDKWEDPSVLELLDFILRSTRGVCAHR